MSVRLTNLGDLINLEKYPGTGSVDELVLNPEGGFYVFQYYYEFDKKTGDVFTTEYVQKFSSSGVAIGKPIDLGSDVDDIYLRSDGSYLVRFDDYSRKFENGKETIDIQTTLAVMKPSGELSPFYTVKIIPEDGDYSDSERDVSIAYGALDGIALARIAKGASGNNRVVDVFDAAQNLKATVIVDRDMRGDKFYSTEVLALSDGRYLVTWVENNSKGADVMARVITAAGKASGSTFVIAHSDELSTPAKVKLVYETTALEDGNFSVAFRASESYYDRKNPSNSKYIELPIETNIWTVDEAGKFTLGLSRALPVGLENPELWSVTKLSNGQVLELIAENRELDTGVVLGTLHGYLYDKNGNATGDTFEFYSEILANNINYAYAVALDDGKFALVKNVSEFASYSFDRTDVIQVYSTTSNDYYTTAGATAGDNTLKGALSSDREEFIDGLDGNDKLYGYTGNDKLLGGGGNDLLDGGKGADRMEGGTGDDTYVVDNMGDKIVEGKGKGKDTVQASVSYTFTDNVDNLVLTGKADINGFGNALANTLSGNTGTNVLYGLGGNDVLGGGLKSDLLNGGGGKDTFVFDTALGPKNIDRIMDFIAADDTIRLDDAIFKGITTGTLKSALFKDIASGLVDKNDRILYDHDKGEIAYDADGSGAVEAVIFAVLDRHPLLTASDFVIV